MLFALANVCQCQNQIAEHPVRCPESLHGEFSPVVLFVDPAPKLKTERVSLPRPQLGETGGVSGLIFQMQGISKAVDAWKCFARLPNQARKGLVDPTVAVLAAPL